MALFLHFWYLTRLIILQRLWPLLRGHLCQFSKWSHFSNISCLLERFFAQNNSQWFVEWILTCFFLILILTQNDHFPWAIAFAWWPTFKMVSFHEYFVFFKAVFAQNNSKWFLERILTCFLEIELLTEIDHFPWAIAFPWWPIFKMVSFLQYFEFSGAVFCTEQL